MIRATIKFKTKRQEKEFMQLDPRLKAIVFEASNFAETLDKIITITECIRTRKEQRKIYPDKPRKRSVHEFNRGADLRVWNWKEIEIKALENRINKYWPYGRKKKSCIVHNVGRGKHFHIQVPHLQ